MLLNFLGRGSAFSDDHNSAFFIENNELVLIDCPAASYQKLKKTDLMKYDNIFVLVTHTHGDHAGGVGMLLQYVWFMSGMKKRVTVVAPSDTVKEDLLLLLNRIEGCEEDWYNITTAEKLKRVWFVSSVPTIHSPTLAGKCFGYHLRIGGKNILYTGDSATLEPFMELIDDNTELYSEISFYKSGVHLYINDVLPKLVQLSENGTEVFLMHLDNEEKLAEIIEDTPLKFVPVYKFE